MNTQFETPKGQQGQSQSAQDRPRVILASASPRRRELLSQAGVAFSVHTAEVDEALDPELAANPHEAACTLAERKAGAVVQELLAAAVPGTYFAIGADTMVVCDGEIFGKPKNLDDAKRMLRALSGITHEVVTGVSAWAVGVAPDGRTSVGRKTFADASRVTFKPLTDEDIADYLRKGESFDKAGAYAVQGEGAALIASVDGALDTVIGLPVGRLLEEFPFLVA